MVFENVLGLFVLQCLMRVCHLEQRVLKVEGARDMNYVVLILSMFGSGLLGVVISVVYYRKHQKYIAKLETLKDFFGYRYALSEKHEASQEAKDSFLKAANEAVITFNKSREVMCALKSFHDAVVSRNTTLADDALIGLTKAMCKELKINLQSFTDQFFKKPFSILPSDRGKVR